MLSEKGSLPGKSGDTTCCERLISVRMLRVVAIKHLVELSVEHEFFATFYTPPHNSGRVLWFHIGRP